jgi:hypothetical protein
MIKDTIPDSSNLLVAVLPFAEKLVHDARGIGLGACISILFHLVLVLVLSVFFSDNRQGPANAGPFFIYNFFTYSLCCWWRPRWPAPAAAWRRTYGHFVNVTVHTILHSESLAGRCA